MSEDNKIRPGNDKVYHLYMEISRDNFIFVYDRNDSGALRYRTYADADPKKAGQSKASVERALEKALDGLVQHGILPTEFDLEIEELGIPIGGYYGKSHYPKKEPSTAKRVTRL